MSAPPQGIVSLTDPMGNAEALAVSTIKKVRLPILKMIVMSILAGVYIGIGSQLYLLVTSTGTSGPEVLLGAGVFSVGLMFIVFVGAELFTGNCLIILPVLTGNVSIWQLLYDWAIVWMGNLFGSILFAALVFGMGINGYDALEPNNEELKLSTLGIRSCKVAVAKGDLRSDKIFFRGIGANILVCLAVIMALAARTPEGKILCIFFPIMTFVALGMEHSVANMYFLSLGTMLKCDISNHGLYWKNLALATLGNIVGAGFLAVSYWFVYVRGKEIPDPDDVIVVVTKKTDGDHDDVVSCSASASADQNNNSSGKSDDIDGDSGNHHHHHADPTAPATAAEGTGVVVVSSRHQHQHHHCESNGSSTMRRRAGTGPEEEEDA